MTKRLFFLCAILMLAFPVLAGAAPAGPNDAAGLKQMRAILMDFGRTYGSDQGRLLADSVLHPLATGLDGGKRRDYASMHQLVASTWGRLEIKYETISEAARDGAGVMEVYEYVHGGREKWRSTFIFTRGGARGWRLVYYYSERQK